VAAGIIAGAPAGIAEAAAPAEAGAAAAGDAWVDCARVPVAGTISMAAAIAAAMDRDAYRITLCLSIDPSESVFLGCPYRGLRDFV